MEQAIQPIERALIEQSALRVLGVFQRGVDLLMLRLMMLWEKSEVVDLAVELIAIGLATLDRYDHLTLNPALCPYLHESLESHEYAGLIARWSEEMILCVEFLVQQRHQNIEFAATLTGMELPNLFALLDRVHQAGDAEATIDLTTSLFLLLQRLGKPRLLERIAQVRDAAMVQLAETWNHAQFEARSTRIEQQLASGQLHEALNGARALLEHARILGDQDYPDADYDLAMACTLLARVLMTTGGPEQGLLLLDEARRRFEAIARERPCRSALAVTQSLIADR